MNIVKRFSDSLNEIWEVFKGFGIFAKAFTIFILIFNFFGISLLLYLSYGFYWWLRDYFSPGASLFIASIAPAGFACLFVMILIHAYFFEPSPKEKTTNELLQEVVDELKSSKR